VQLISGSKTLNAVLAISSPIVFFSNIKTFDYEVSISYEKNTWT
jgi:hypothetical protein